MPPPDVLKLAEAAPRDLLPILQLSHILTDTRFEEVRAKVGSGQYPSESGALARRLVDEAILTDYQAGRLLKDRGHGLANERYVILDLIGSGSMGQVYRARHKLMGRIVALKMISAERVHSPGKVARFRREVLLASRLDHPNVVRAFDADQFEGIPCLVMEYVPGQDLERRIRARGPLSPAKATRYAAQAALGLKHAHEQGIIHRDIKPSNLLLGPGGQIKVLDFGVGALMESWDDSDTHQTAEGMVCGTVDYMSPEQVTCGKLDGRSDLYNLGCTLYVLLTGRTPFPGPSKIERLARRIHSSPVPITDVLPNLHPGLVRTLDRLIATEPEDRFPTAAEAAEALLALTVLKGPSAAAPPGPRRTWPIPPAADPGPSLPQHGQAADPMAFAVPLSAKAPSRPDPAQGVEASWAGTTSPALDSYRDGLEQSGAASGREVEPGYLATVARINQMEINRLSKELEEARQQRGEASDDGVELTEIFRDLKRTLQVENWPKLTRDFGTTLLEEHWPKLVFVALVSCAAAFAWLVSWALG
jgi:serine/threonine-protein kinase